MTVNFFKRVCRHLFILPNAVRKCFPKYAMWRIEAAIANSEMTHFGEIRFAIEPQLPLLDVFRKKSAKKRALEVFSQLHVWDTEHNNGVLIYLLLADHDFEILADRGIHCHIGDEGWTRISDEMETLFRHGQFEAGVLHGITKISALLVQHFPATGKNDNELSNTPVII